MSTKLFFTSIPTEFTYDGTDIGGFKFRLNKLSLDPDVLLTAETASHVSPATSVTLSDWFLLTKLTLFRHGGDKSYLGWITDPLLAPVHISTAATVNLWGYQTSGMNGALAVQIYIIDRNGNPADYGRSVTIQAGKDNAGLGTSAAEMSFSADTTTTPRTVEPGERIMVLPLLVDAPSLTLAAGTGYIVYGTGSSTGYSYITFTENMTFVDYTSTNPDSIGDNTVSLGGVLFKTTGPVRVNMSSAYPGKISQGDYGRNDNARISTFSVSNLTGGHGVWRYRSQGGFLQDGDRYWTGRNIDPWPGALVIGPEVTTVSTLNNSYPRHIQELWVGGSNYMFVSSADSDVNGYYSSADGTTFTPRSTGSTIGAIKQAIQLDKQTVGVMGASDIGGTSNIETISDNAATGVLFSTCTVYDGFVYFLPTDASPNAGLLYRLSINSGLWGESSVTPALVTSTAEANLYSVLSPNKNIELYTYEDASGFPAIWALTNGGAAVYSFDDVTWYKAKFDILPFKKRLDTGLSGADYQTLGKLWKESLIYQTGLLTLNKLTMSNGQLIVEDLGFVGHDGIAADAINTFNYDGEIMAMTADQNHLFAMVGKNAVAGNASQTGLFLYRSGGWHPIWGSSSQYDTYAMGTGSVNGTPRLYFGLSSSNLSSINLEKLDRAPYASSSPSRRYNTAGGVVVLPYFDAGYEAQAKLALRLRVKMTSPTKGQTIKVLYRTNGSTAGWKALSDNTANSYKLAASGEHILRFGPNNEGEFFNSIQFRIDLSTNDPDLTPVLEYIELEYLREPEVERGYVVNIDMSTEVGGLTPQQQEDMLWSMIKRKELVMFSYRPEERGAWNSTNAEYDGMAQSGTLVKVIQPDGVSRIGPDNRGQWAVYLAEMNRPIFTSPA